MDTFNFDFETFKKEALEKVKQGKPLTGKGGVVDSTYKRFF